MNTLTYLAKLNSHDRDQYISLHEPTHTYTINGDSNYTSVTTWNSSHFEYFDADKIIKNMMNSSKWTNKKYYGKTPNEIKQIWDNNRNQAASAGIQIHYDIECYYNNCPNNNESIEYGYFKNFLLKFPELKPYRTEWKVFHEDLKLAGSIDMVFENENGNLLIYDWKRCKKIVKTNGFNKFAKNDLIQHIPDTNYWRY